MSSSESSAPTVRFSIFGAGRIGAVHAANVATHRRAELRFVYDVSRDAALELTQEFGGELPSAPEEAIGHDEVDAVLIASSTNTHVDLIRAALAAKKPIFCEKPIDLDLERVKRCATEIEASGGPCLIGFNRRFDPSHHALCETLRAGEIGSAEMVLITSRDPAPASLELSLIHI